MNDVPVRTWCQEQGTDWQTIFCERVMHCVLRADQRCREEVCFGAPVAEQTNCQTRCLEYAKSSPRAVAVSFTQSMETECEEFQGSQQSSSSFNATSVLDSMGSGIPSECMDLALQQLQIFNTMADQQSSRSQDQCSFATLAVNNVDFIAGISAASAYMHMCTSISFGGSHSDNIKHVFSRLLRGNDSSADRPNPILAV